MSEYNQRPDEPFIQYAKRLINGCESKLYDIDKTEIYELLFGEKLSSCESRKRLYGLKAAIGKIENEILPDETQSSEQDDVASDILVRIKEERRELEKAKIQYRDQKRENNSILRLEARIDNVKDYIQHVANDISKTKILKVGTNQIRSSSENEGVLLISDWHYGMEIDNFLNKYNKEVFVGRIEKLVDNTIMYGIENNINTLHICNLGDLCAGLIHPNIRVTSSEDVISQTMFVAEVLAEIMTAFAEVFPQVKLYSVLDNHSRVTPNLNDSLAIESFARFLPWWVQARLKDIHNIEVITKNIDEDIAVFKVKNSLCLMTHGHRDKLPSVAANLSMMLKIHPDYIFMSHYHHTASFEKAGCETILNSSLMGMDDYAKHLRLSAHPSQTFIVFDDEGKKCQYNIKVDNYNG